jgi:hypothetical protein
MTKGRAVLPGTVVAEREPFQSRSRTLRSDKKAFVQQLLFREE